MARIGTDKLDVRLDVSATDGDSDS